MKHNHRAIFLALAALLLLLTAGAVVLAQTSAGFNLEWHVIGSGGGETSSASYHINGTIGQSIDSPPTSGSANYKASSGYWFAGTGTGTTLYLPALQKN
jgi:hypothetical protein